MSSDRERTEQAVLVIGGTRFIGRHTVTEFLDHGYRVTMLNRGRHPNPFEADDRVRHLAGDRTDVQALKEANAAIDPDIVIDCVAYHPSDVRTATEVFDEVSAYVYVSSGGVYGVPQIPKREGETPLYECSDEQARDETMASYGPRKAEGDRAIFAAAERGINAMSVRPTVVYGPHDYSGRFDYWIGRILDYDRVIVPGDGTNIWHRVYVEDVASALRIVAEDGHPGEAYNCADHELVTLAGSVDRFAEAVDDPTELIFASPRELARVELSLADFPVYRPNPHILATTKLERLGWTSTPLNEAVKRTVDEFRRSERDGRQTGPSRAREERLLEELAHE